MSKKKILGNILAIVILTASCLLPDNSFLSQEGMRTVGLLLSFLVILITEAIPVVVTSLIYCAIMPLLGVVDNLGSALSGFSQPIVFFTLASFGIAAAMTTIPLSKRILRVLLKRFGRDVQSVLLAMMIACALFSSIVSNVPTCAIFMAISLDFIKLYENEEDRKRSGRTFMIAIPVASMIGGMMTPAGSSINLIAISQLELQTGMSISFARWMCTGTPLAIVMIPLAWILAVKIYKPASVSKKSIQGFISNMDIPAKVNGQEVKVIAIVSVMLILWISSSWIPVINVMIVAILGCSIMFLPGIEVLNVDTFLKENSWDAFFLVGTVLSVSNAMIQNGVSDFIASLVPSLQFSTPLLIAFTAVLIFISLLVIPVATSLVPIMASTLITVAVNASVSPALIMMTAAICACNCYLLPLDTVTLITYGKGYYAMTDMAKSTVFLQIAIVFLAAFWISTAGKLFGMI